MPIYEEESRITREELLELRRYNKCKECGERLDVFIDLETRKAFLACTDWRRTHHEGIEKEASRYQKEGLASLNIETRREIMEKEFGKETTTALEQRRLPTSGALTQLEAMHILKLVYPEAPEDEIVRCALLCRDFGLHPLMKEVYLIPFKDKSGKDNYVTVMGINATRKLMSQRGTFSYVDNTPRVMTEKEEKEIFGEMDEGSIIAITKLRTKDGLEAQGYGKWPRGKDPYGIEKGNTKTNMAFIRSERNAFGRLFTDALPPNIEIIDETYAEVPDIVKVDTGTGEIIEGEVVDPTEKPEPKPKKHWCEEHNCAFEKKVRGSSTWYAHKLDGGWCNEIKKKKAQPETQASIIETSDVPNQETAEEPLKRDPSTIKTINELQKSLFDDFRLQPKQQLAELNLDSWSELAISPAEAYRQVAASR